MTIENVDDAYTMMLGNWVFTGVSQFEPGGTETYNLSMKTPDPVLEAEYYGHELYAFGINGYDFLYIPFSFAYDEETDTMDGPSFGPNMPVTTPDFDHIVFDPATEFFLAVMPYPALNRIAGYFAGWNQMTLERVK